jgi:acetyl esterase/lipase
MAWMRMLVAAPPLDRMPTAQRHRVLMLWLLAWLAMPGGSSSARAQAWAPAPGHTQIVLWPGKPPGEDSDGKQETVSNHARPFVAGKPILWVEHVSQPTLTVYAPSAANSGAAVLVFPGGGYEGLAIDVEGTEVCDWLVTRGVTCIVVKYRVPAHQGDAPYNRGYPNSVNALQDAQRALRLVRARATELSIDPARIGVLGFSAGGHLAALLSVHFREQIYSREDAADDQSCRPDFAVALYPGRLAPWPPSLVLNPDIFHHITRETPPTFLIQAEDDHTANVDDALAYYLGLKHAEVAVEMHLYAHGGHGFGLRATDDPVTAWPALVETWFKSLGMLAR